jgi:hypothetical protein
VTAPHTANRTRDGDRMRARRADRGAR